ncbi:hypothetical protein ANCDUO_00892 [Ancylostoma duodenale]|uniref:Cadherin domain-containing protein n=1 Tax=Ancylostoma duodenale TaxID=51022 RepID=A0A0C2HGK9_9BILA|nr:hypothetical protein ANCDUO_00892 [Ancylostoma duodenale]
MAFYSGLFAIEDGGRLILARRPMDSEMNRYIQLNITAENSHGKDWTLLNVFVEGELTSTAPTTPTMDGAGNDSACYFPTKVYSTEFMENVRGRKRLLKVTSSCESEGRPYEYSFAYPSSEFELDAKTGEVFVKVPLDREQRSYHFLYINVSSPAVSAARRVVRQNPIIERTLTPTQTLVVVRVLDENDNAPAFLHGAEDDDALTAAVDWQARLFTPIIRLEAKDADERPTLTYSISGTGSEYFLVNATSGLVILAKSIADYTGDSFQLTATVTDGLHIVPTPLRIYVISPSSSLVQLTAEVPHSEIDQRVVERTLNELNGLDNHLLAKQPFVDHQGHADPTRSPYVLTTPLLLVIHHQVLEYKVFFQVPLVCVRSRHKNKDTIPEGGLGEVSCCCAARSLQLITPLQNSGAPRRVTALVPVQNLRDLIAFPTSNDLFGLRHRPCNPRRPAPPPCSRRVLYPRHLLQKVTYYYAPTFSQTKDLTSGSVPLQQVTVNIWCPRWLDLDPTMWRRSRERRLKECCRLVLCPSR